MKSAEPQKIDDYEEYVATVRSLMDKFKQDRDSCPKNEQSEPTTPKGWLLSRILIAFDLILKEKGLDADQYYLLPLDEFKQAWGKAIDAVVELAKQRERYSTINQEDITQAKGLFQGVYILPHVYQKTLEEYSKQLQENLELFLVANYKALYDNGNDSKLDDNNLLCPITMELIRDPVFIVKPDGTKEVRFYERGELEKSMAKQDTPTSPTTREPIQRLVPASIEYLEKLRQFVDENPKGSSSPKP